MYLKVAFLALLLFSSANSNSQRILEILEIESANEVIQKHIDVFVDESNSLIVDQVSSSSMNHQFQSIQEFESTLSNENTYWLRLFVDIQNPELLPLGLNFHRQNHQVVVYYFTDSLVQKKRTGFFVPGKENEEIIPLSNTLPLSVKGKVELYIKFKNTYDELPNFHFSFVDLKEESAKNNFSVIFDAFVLGMMCILFFYGAFLFYQNKEKLYIHYALYILFLSIWYLTCFEFGYKFIDNLPRSIFPYSDVPALLAFIFYIQFGREFINTKQHLPKWDKALYYSRYIILAFCIFLPVFILVTKRVLVGYSLFGSFSFLLFIFLISFIIKLFRSKIQYSNILALGSTLIILGSVYYGIHSTITKEYFFFSQKLGTLLELIVFTYGISVRYRIIEREKRTYQANLIGQLEENVKLKDKVTRELEEKVQERTVEIAEKNEKLVHQNEEIASQNDLLLQKNEEIETQRDELKMQRDVVLAQKTEIVDSITYAQRIQAAMLPPETYITELLNENFIFYKPRDIVSGDFYWIKQVNMSVILVAADCTGHGVPGALLSMLGMSYLDEIVQRREITQANQVLNELRNQIKHSLRQRGQMDESRDGIDIALCVMDLRNMKMQYAGANNPLYLIKDVNGEPELKEIKADPMPLGYYQGKDKPFTNHSIQLDMGDSIYIFSDGFIDQKGGRDNKKFMSKNFKNLLLEIHDRPMHEQKEFLAKTLSDWRGNNAQMDDVLVIGVRI